MLPTPVSQQDYEPTAITAAAETLVDPALDLMLALEWFYNQDWSPRGSMDDFISAFSRDSELNSHHLSTTEEQGEVRYRIETDYAAEMVAIMIEVERYLNISVLPFLDPDSRKFSFGRVQGRGDQTLPELVLQDFKSPFTPRHLFRMFVERLRKVREFVSKNREIGKRPAELRSPASPTFTSSTGLGRRIAEVLQRDYRPASVTEEENEDLDDEEGEDERERVPPGSSEARTAQPQTSKGKARMAGENKLRNLELPSMVAS
jgi:hypothetical protein